MMSHETKEFLLRLEASLNLDEAVVEAGVYIHKVSMVSNNN